MAMRADCRHYESRTYPSGDVVRKCRLDLAPEAPWKCPDDCPRYERRRIDAGWHYGSLGPTAGAAPPPPAPDLGEDVAALLDSAEEIVNEAGRRVLDEQEKRGKRRRLGRRRKR